MRPQINFLWFFVWFLAACSAPVASSDFKPEPTMLLSVTPTSLARPTQSVPIPATTTQPTGQTSPIVEPRAPTPGAVFQFCSPLAGYTLIELPEIVSNPYHPPAPGSDDPHQAVDLADRIDGSDIAVEGMPVLAMLPGRVVLSQADRFPYGYAVMVESALQSLPEVLQASLPAVGAMWTPNPALICPVLPRSEDFRLTRSIYVLYAHLQEPSLLEIGDTVTCGQVLGAVGQSGNALAPHLHLEIRVGPAGWRLESLAHYTNDASQDEIAQYCTWRVSGIFQHLDPLVWMAERR